MEEPSLEAVCKRNHKTNVGELWQYCRKQPNEEYTGTIIFAPTNGEVK
jgi:hypothetical protein